MADSDNSAACFIHPQKATDNYLRTVKLLSKLQMILIQMELQLKPERRISVTWDLK